MEYSAVKLHVHVQLPENKALDYFVILWSKSAVNEVNECEVYCSRTQNDTQGTCGAQLCNSIISERVLIN